MAGVEEHGVHPHRQPAPEPLGGADQLQAEAHFARRAQVVGLQLLDPLVAHVVEVHRRAEREAREDRHLRRRVPAADVVARVGLGVAAALRLGERLGVGAAAVHLAEDVVGRAVDDPVDPLDRGRRQRLLEHAHHRDGARDGRLEAQPHAVLARGLEQLLPVLGEQLLVRRDDVDAGAHRRQQVLARGLDPAHHLDDDVRLGEDLGEVPARARQHAGDRPGGGR